MGEGQTVLGIGGPLEAVPRWFSFSRGGKTSSVSPGPVPNANGAPSMAGFDLEGRPAAVSAAGALVYYLRSTQKADLAHVRSLERRDADEYKERMAG